MNPKISAGTEVYNADSSPVVARGIVFTAEELSAALGERLPPLLHDEAGKQEVAAVLAKAATTEFQTDRIREILERPVSIEDWRVGEAFAEAYLVDHRGCEFPWPHGRDVRNPNASPAGADLVGFQHLHSGPRFAFGEVKTSEQKNCPPTVLSGRSGLVRQLEVLRDSAPAKDHLVQYLAFRAVSAAWNPAFKLCAARYLTDRSDISLFGILIRDVSPDQKDLGSRVVTLADKCPTLTSIELRVKYLPSASIATLASRLEQAT